MGTPLQIEEAMNDWAGLTVQSLVRGRFNPKKTKILDVGAGWGKYKLLLPEYKMDACEIWEPYVSQENLSSLYDTVFISDICDLVIDHYDAIIFGDVFEHIDKDDASDLLARIRDLSEEVYIVVPYLYHQGVVDDNPYEVHLQPDLTPHVMKQRYPELRLVVNDGDLKGLYSWK